MNDRQSNEFQNDNPYSAPVHSEQTWAPQIPANGGFIRQVRPLCICMIIQGVLETLMGLMWGAMAIFVPMFAMNQQGGAGPQIPPGQQQTIQTVIGVSYGIIGALVIFAGVFRVVGGARGLFFRSRRVGLISHFVGLLSFLTCYCLPTSIGLCVWGCIVYFKPEVKNAFMMGEAGHSAADIESGVTLPPLAKDSK